MVHRRARPTFVFRLALVGLVALSPTFLVACGDDGEGSDESAQQDDGSEDGSDDGSDDSSDDGSDDSSDDSSDEGSDEDEYSWEPPAGDLSVQEFERQVSNALAVGCAEGQAELDQLWDVFLSPRSVLLYQAAVHVCEGNIDAGRAMFDLATNTFGWETGVAPWVADCDIYQRVVSVLEQRPRLEVVCPSGNEDTDDDDDLPPWPTQSDPLLPFDDPRTPDVDESQVSTNTSSPPDTGTTNSSPDTGLETTTSL